MKHLRFWPCLLALLTVTPAGALSTLGTTESVLIFPVIKNGPSHRTVVTVSNTNQDDTLCSGPFRRGEVGVRFVYYTRGCIRIDVIEPLTPTDSLTVVTIAHSQGLRDGFLVVEALDPVTQQPIDFDFLIGSAQVLDTTRDLQWTYLPYSFQALPPGGAPFGTDSCGRAFVEGTSPSTMDFDEREYSSFPARVYLGHFAGEGNPEPPPVLEFSNRLYLMTTSDGPETLDMLFWNNNERQYSRSFQVNCSQELGLGDVSSLFDQDDLAFGGRGSEYGGIATGWFQLAPDGDFGVLGVFVQSLRFGTKTFLGGQSLQIAGSKLATLPRIQ